MIRLLDEFSHTLEIEKSRFICTVKKCTDEAQAKAFIQRIKKEHPNATHHCTAYIAYEHNELQRSSDDGEPSGTAGVPMLEALKMSQIKDVCAVVVRYYGGIKLGAGGLIRAYSNSVSTTLKLAPKVRASLVSEYSLQFSYDYIGKIDYLLSEQATIMDKQYQEQVLYTFYSDSDTLIKQIQELTKGKFIPQYSQAKIIEIPYNDL